MFDPANRSHFDTTDLDIDISSYSGRSPLLVAFTPPHKTYSAIRCGLDENGNAKRYWFPNSNFLPAREKAYPCHCFDHHVSVLIIMILRQHTHNHTHCPIAKRHSSRPESIPVPTDWVAPGRAGERQDIIRILVENGADVNRKDLHDYTPLHLACMWGWVSSSIPPSSSYWWTRGMCLSFELATK